jgi:hypothetical protein
MSRSLQTSIPSTPQGPRFTSFKYLADDKPELFASLLCRLIPIQGKVQCEGTVEHTIIKAKPETQMTPQELADYYNKLRALRPSTKPLVIIDNDTGEPLYSKAAE